MKRTYFKLILATVFLVMYFAVSAEAEERIHWYIQQGKGRPLCESLTQTANSNPPMPPLERIIPNIPWKQVLAIKGVREPEWKELDPLKYEDFFLKARKFKADENGYDEGVIPFTRWFLPPKERWSDKPIPISDEEALKIYRNFVRRGGKFKVFRYDVGNKKQPMLRDFVQYESPEKDFSDWDGYTLQAEPDLTGIPWAGGPLTQLGRGYRLLIYKNGLFSFVGFRRGYDEYRVMPMSYDRALNFSDNSPYSLDTYFCKINIKVD